MPGPHLPTPAKPKLPSDKRRAREADRLKTIRLRVTIGRELDNRGITSSAEIGAALGIPGCRGGQAADPAPVARRRCGALEAAAARLGLLVPSGLKAERTTPPEGCGPKTAGGSTARR